MEKIITNPKLLGHDIALLFVQLRNEAKALRRAIYTRQSDEAFALFMDCYEDFYGLWLSTFHHVSDYNIGTFFDGIMKWSSNKEDDEESFFEELFDKSIILLRKIQEYAQKLKDVGILDLTRVEPFEEMGESGR